MKMDFFSKIIKLFFFVSGTFFPISTNANEITYQNLIKRNISTKIMNAEKVIKGKDLDRFVTLSVVVNEEIIYCHYEKENRSKLKLIMCY